MRQGEQILERLQAHICIRTPIEAGETDAAIWRNRVRNDGVSDFKRVRPRTRDAQGNLGFAVERLKHVAYAPTPAGLRDLVRDGGLPLHRLVRVRKKLRRDGGAAREILRARDRRDQGADIRHDSELALVEQRLELNQVGMETEIAAVAILERERKKRRLRNSENAAGRGVGIITGRVSRDDDVIGIVAAKKEETDEGLVVAAR